MAQNRYNLESPGASAGDAIRELLLQREVQKRQAMLDALNQRNVESQMADREAARAAQKAQLESMDEIRANQRADRIAWNLVPDQAVAPGDVDALTKGGLGSLVEAPPTVAGIPQMSVADVATGQLPTSKFKGTYEQRAAGERAAAMAAEKEAERTFRADQSRLLAEEKAAQAERDRQIRLQIAQMGADARAGSQSVADQLKELQIQEKQGKLDAAAKEKTDRESAARTTTQGALDIADRLLSDKDLGQYLGAASGRYELRGKIPEFLGGSGQGVSDFNAAQDQLVAMLTQPNLGALKGPMSDRDVVFVKQLATRLGDQNLSDKERRTALVEAQKFLRNKLSAQGGDTTVAAGGGRKTARNPKTGETLYSDDGGQTWHK